MERFSKTTMSLLTSFRKVVKPLTTDERQEIKTELALSSMPGFDFFLLVILSCAIATSGLMTNSAAVIIGAMLVAPLMSPIIGLGLASVTGDDKLLRTAAWTLILGAHPRFAFFRDGSDQSAFYPSFSFRSFPPSDRPYPPTPTDLIIALPAGWLPLAMTRKNLSAALPCVAIANALSPRCSLALGSRCLRVGGTSPAEPR